MSRRRWRGWSGTWPGVHLDITRLRHHDVSMRTTLTLDDDLVEQLKERAHRSRRPFKDVVNETIRHGLGFSKPVKIPPFKVKPWNLGLPREYEGKLNQLVDKLEVEAYLQKRRKLEGR